MVAISTTPPPIQAPTAKEKKYDRQLRLWAATGQRALEDSHVLLVVPDQAEGSGSSVAGVEALKNLILPSIGSFTIADSATVKIADLGVNFFLEEGSLGKSRAEECTRLLEELNPDVTGYAITRPLDVWLADPRALEHYNLILLCSPIPIDHRETICSHAQRKSIPLIYIHSIGFYSSFSLQIPSKFPIVDTHPDSDSMQDLRLLAPWPELSDQVNALGNLMDLDDADHGHVPYILLLLHYLEEWKAFHEGRPPDTFKEKTQFRNLVRAGARTDNPEGGEENFDEAVAAVLKTINPPAIGNGCRDMFEMEHCTNLRPDSANFWVIASSVRSFYKAHGVLPLPGSLPDMKARSADYIKLQNTYKTKARKDVGEVLGNVRETERVLGRNTPAPGAEVEAFCKNAAHVKVLHGTSLPHTRLTEPKTASRILQNLQNKESLLPVFVSLLAAETPNVSPISDEAQLLISTLAGGKVPEDLDLGSIMNAVEEVERASGGGELHNTSSLTGGMVAQEAIKLITRQYVPVDNTCVFDGIRCRTEVLRL